MHLTDSLCHSLTHTVVDLNIFCACPSPVPPGPVEMRASPVVREWPELFVGMGALASTCGPGGTKMPFPRTLFSDYPLSDNTFSSSILCFP